MSKLFLGQWKWNVRGDGGVGFAVCGREGRSRRILLNERQGGTVRKWLAMDGPRLGR